MRRVLVLLLALFVASIARRASADNEKLKVLVPEKENLQYMTFSIAKSGGFFAKNGIDLEMVVAPVPAKAESMFEAGETDAAVLPPPMYLRLVANKRPIVIVASLLRNDPIDLVVRPEVMQARKLSPTMPTADKIKALKGMKIGIAPHPPARLRALLATQGMDAEKDVEMVVILGKEQNAAFHDKKVEALYAHTPYLERAITQDGAVVFVNQSGGEVKELAHRLIHGFVFRKDIYVGREHVVIGAVKALAEAQALVHRSRPEAVAMLAKEYPTRSKNELETIVDLYEPAIPDAPDVHIEDLAPSLDLFPEGVPKPDLSGIDLKPFVATEIAAKTRPSAGGKSTRMIVIVIAALVALVSVAVMLKGRGAKKEEEKG